MTDRLIYLEVRTIFFSSSDNMKFMSMKKIFFYQKKTFLKDSLKWFQFQVNFGIFIKALDILNQKQKIPDKNLKKCLKRVVNFFKFYCTSRKNVFEFYFLWLLMKKRLQRTFQRVFMHNRSPPPSNFDFPTFIILIAERYMRTPNAMITSRECRIFLCAP